jgi:hypothetical protein
MAVLALALGGNHRRGSVLGCDEARVPFARLNRSASDLTVALELLCIDAEVEWEAIYPGKLSDRGVIERRARLKRVQLEAEHKHFPDGFEPGPTLIAPANRRAQA